MSLQCALANDKLELNGDSLEYRLNPNLYYLIDDGTSTITDILALEKSAFQPVGNEDLRRDLSDDHIWLYTSISSQSSSTLNYIIEFSDPSISSIILHEVSNGNIKKSVTGTLYAQDEKDLAGSINNFFIKIPPGQTVELYFDVSSHTSITISAELYPEDKAISRYLTRHALFGAFYGIIFLLVSYNLLLFFVTKQRDFLIYGIYALSVAAFTGAGDGFFPMYFNPLVVFLNAYHDILFFVISNFLGLVFMIQFLKIKDWHPALYKGTYIYGIFLAFITLVLFFISKPMMLSAVQLLGLTTLAVFLIGGILGYKNEIDQAKYYLLSYVLFGAFIVIFVLSQFRVIPFSVIVQYSIHIGYALSMIILSYGLSQRIYFIYKSLLIKEKEKKEIIEQKNAELEEKVAERTADIARKELNLRQILDNNDNLIWLIDQNFELIDCNVIMANLWEKFFGTRLEQGKNILELMTDEEIREKWRERFVETLKGNAAVYIEDYKIGEDKLFFEIKGFPIHEGKAIIGIVFFAKNITEQLLYEKQLKNQNIMLKKVNKELDSFVYSASHDLKAPLASVLGLINLVKKENNLETRLEYYEMMEKSVVRLDTFIKDIIDYSRNERTDIDFQSINIGEIIENIFSDLRYINGIDKITKNVNINQPIHFISDPIRIKVALRNLISNSLKYGCAEHIEKKQVDIEVRVSEKVTEFTIRDYGEGINEEHEPHIFEMFYRANEQSTGTGLGLYIVKETIEKLKGEVHYNNTVTPGASFSLIIPNRLDVDWETNSEKNS